MTPAATCVPEDLEGLIPIELEIAALRNLTNLTDQPLLHLIRRNESHIGTSHERFRVRVNV